MKGASALLARVSTTGCATDPSATGPVVLTKANSSSGIPLELSLISELVAGALRLRSAIVDFHNSNALAVVQPSQDGGVEPWRQGRCDRRFPRIGWGQTG